jgi:hypothetical protein
MSIKLVYIGIKNNEGVDARCRLREQKWNIKMMM